MTVLWFFKRVEDHSNYIICSDGTLYSIARGCKVIPMYFTSRQGYGRYHLRTGGKTKNYTLRNLVIRHFYNGKKPRVIDEDCPF